MVCPVSALWSLGLNGHYQHLRVVRGLDSVHVNGSCLPPHQAFGHFEELTLFYMRCAAMDWRHASFAELDFALHRYAYAQIHIQAPNCSYVHAYAHPQRHMYLYYIYTLPHQRVNESFEIWFVPCFGQDVGSLWPSPFPFRFQACAFGTPSKIVHGFFTCNVHIELHMPACAVLSGCRHHKSC